MTLTELRKSIELKSKKINTHLSRFDSDFLAHVYLACLYEHRVQERLPKVLDNLKYLIPVGAAVLQNKASLSESVARFIPSDGVPTKRDLEGLPFNPELLDRLTNGSVKPRLDELLKEIG